MTNVDLVRLAGSRGRISESPTVDPVTAEVDPRRHGDGVLRDGGVRVAHRDHADPQPVERAQRDGARRVRAGSPRCRSGIPQFMLTSTLPVRFALEFLGVDEFHEGDVFVANDPYHGGGHLPDYNVFAPVFADGPTAHGGWC